MCQGCDRRWTDQIAIVAFPKQIAAHPASHHVPSRIQSRLKDICYVKEVLGGIVLTDDGLRALR
jgi:hypothetical protein